MEEEGPSSSSRTLQALRAIAKEKTDWNLLRTARTLQLQSVTWADCLGQAYSLLQIDNHACTEDTVLTYYLSALDDATSEDRKLALKEAVLTIGEERESNFLMKKAEDPDAEVTSTVSVTQPVGITNIGNTCYLNSILQFYYTINVIRDTVSNFNNLQLALDGPDNTDTFDKIVGGRRIRKPELLSSQKCTYFVFSVRISNWL